ncbi:MAG: putative tail tubular protein [Prokaryotic dsDNA virus sp.]|nr:MAG: putative tail tubular protein [Prokaryotic dsDNA virus sp.]|tara:strand:- start:19321 stop:19935 length:615 start_codon:yes stop_codon:yes gene_type:complete
MAFPTTNSQQELPAVNQILQSCGQAPVTTLDQTNPDVAIAYQTLLEVSREVQAEGWSFNKEYHYKMNRDTNNEILIPNNVLQIDTSDEAANVELDVIRRNGKLYDKASHKYTFDRDINCDIVWLFDWVDIPRPIADFITARAASVTSSRIVGDTSQYQILQQKEAFTRAMAMEYECNQGDYTYFGHSGETNRYQSYKPYNALYR